MDFEQSARSGALQDELAGFLAERVVPAEPLWEEQVRADPTGSPAVLEELTAEARARGLWNLFLPLRTPYDPPGREPLSTLDYAPLAELSGRSPLGPEAINCAAPDTGNMEVLAVAGTRAQQDRWLRPLLEGTIRSAYAMTEPAVASSDATNIATSIRRDGDSYVVDGRKWWISGAGREACRVLLVLGVTDPGADRHRRHSVVLVPRDAPGVEIVRPLPVFGYLPAETHCEVTFTGVRVPVDHLVGGEGEGFAIAQRRLGPGRVHHCMRLLGAAERALELMVARAKERVAFGRPLAEQGVVREWIADSRIEIDQARLYVLRTAWLLDAYGPKGARSEVAGIKVVAPNVACRVIDRAIQVHGGAGVGPDTPLARMYADARTLRLADGPDEVHRRSVARAELARPTAGSPPPG